MFNCLELNKSFETKVELFKALKENKTDILSLKMANVLKSCDKGTSVKTKMFDVSKHLDTVKNITMSKDCYYIVVNTTGILDSHMDLHLKGIWNKTAQEQQGKNYLVADHMLEIDKVITRKEHVEIIIAEIPFRSIGKDYDGNTQALIYKIPKDKIMNEAAKEWLKSGDEIEASVRMQYVKIELAMNSDDINDKMEKANYDTYLSEIANKDDFEEINYFYLVQEAKNLRESSLVVFGSNSATGIMEYKQQPSKDTVESERAAAKALQTKNYFINLNS
jgi:hypothetical protein